MTAIRAAITQTTWTGDKESMLDKHEQFAREAKTQGAQVGAFAEVFKDLIGPPAAGPRDPHGRG